MRCEELLMRHTRTVYPQSWLQTQNGGKGRVVLLTDCSFTTTDHTLVLGHRLGRHPFAMGYIEASYKDVGMFVVFFILILAQGSFLIKSLKEKV
jgi:hypothetical protein